MSTSRNDTSGPAHVSLGLVGHREYELTDLERRTDWPVLELAGFGMVTERGPDIGEPGNLRTLVLPRRMALAAPRSRPTLYVRLVVDDEPFVTASTPDNVNLADGDTTSDVKSPLPPATTQRSTSPNGASRATRSRPNTSRESTQAHTPTPSTNSSQPWASCPHSLRCQTAEITRGGS